MSDSWVTTPAGWKVKSGSTFDEVAEIVIERQGLKGDAADACRKYAKHTHAAAHGSGCGCEQHGRKCPEAQTLRLAFGWPANSVKPIGETI